MNLGEWETASWAFIAILFGTMLRSLILASLCGLAVWLLRSKTAALRFSLWKWMLFALLALPALIRVTPPVLKRSRAVAQLETTVLPRQFATTPVTVGPEPNKQPLASEPAKDSAAWVLAIPAIYLFVTLWLLGRFLCNLRQLHRIAARSHYIPETKFRELAHEIWLSSGAFLKPRLTSSDKISVPVTFDAEDIWILLPHSWREWDEAKLRVVLTHEMAHIERGDSATLHVASLATCLFWFHPLSWFLRRQLCALAEEACDEVVVASTGAPEQYANFLIDFAAEVSRWHGRLIPEATGVARSSSLHRRIEKLFALNPPAPRGKRITALAMTLFAPALYLSAAARFDQPPSQPKIVWPLPGQIAGLSEADVAALEATLQTHPEDLDTRMELLVYFGQNAQDLPFTSHLLWFIQHHPEVSTLPMAQGMFRFSVQMSESSAEQIRTVWEDAVAKHGDSPVVLANAASFLERTDPERGLQLFRDAQSLDPNPNRYEWAIAMIYAAAELEAIRPGGRLNNIRMNAETSAKLRAQLEGSGDPALLAAVGDTLTHMGSDQQGLALIRQAIALDPGNAKWTATLEDALAEPERRAAFKRLRSEPPKPGLVRIGSAIAEASLISKVDPIYPAVALAARIQGTVEFTVTVGADGKVENLELVRGHPMLVEAAKAAVLKWVYHAATQDGKPIPFETQVIIPFRLTE